jgi:predicted ferric reductase
MRTQKELNFVNIRFKEQVIYGCTYRIIEALRVAATAFMEALAGRKTWIQKPKSGLQRFYNEQPRYLNICLILYLLVVPHTNLCMEVGMGKSPMQ